MAEAEHAGWYDWHIEPGWKRGPKEECEKTKNPTKKTHHCLIPYSKLSHLERNKDRDSIRHYLEFANAANMKIVPV